MNADHPARSLGLPARRLTLLVALAAISLLIVSVPGYEPTTQNFTFVAGGGVLFLIGVGGAVAMSGSLRLRQALGQGRLGPFVALWFAVAYGLASMKWRQPQGGIKAIISSTSVEHAMVVAGVGMLTFAMGYCLTPLGLRRSWQNVLGRLLGNETAKPTQRTVLCIFAIGLAAAAGQISLGKFGYLSDAGAAVSTGDPVAQAVAVLATFQLFAVALAARALAGSRTLFDLAVFFGVFTSALAISAIGAQKEAVGLVAVAALLGFASSGHRLPVIATTILLLGFVTVVVPFISSYRDAVAAGGGRLTPAQAIKIVPEQLSQTLSGKSSSNSKTSQATFFDRLGRIDDVAIIVQKTPASISYRPISEILLAPVLGLVPRAVWPNKPILATGYVFSQQYYELPRSIYTSNAPTPTGDLYRHGGWPPVIAGMAIFGICVRLLDEASALSRQHPARVFFAISFFGLVVKQEIDMVSLIAAVPSLLFGIAVCARLIPILNAQEAQATPTGSGKASRVHRVA